MLMLKLFLDKITPDIQKKRLYIEMTIEEGGQFKVNDVKVEVQNTSIYSVEDVFPRISLKKMMYLTKKGLIGI